jgi:hypothetical protein
VSEFESLEGQDISPVHVSRPVLGSIQRPIQWVPGAFSFAVKWPLGEVDQSSPTGAEVRKRGSVHEFALSIHVLVSYAQGQPSVFFMTFVIAEV